MGEKKIYRWNTRRAAKARRASGFALDIFDYGILILIFAMWLLVLRFSMIFAITSSHCIEQLTNFGRSADLPHSVFEIAAYISVLFGVFWGLIAMKRFRTKRSFWTWAAWHGIIAFAILMLWAACLSLTSSQSIKPPDGIMNTRPVVKTVVNDEVTYEPEAHPLETFAQWQQGSKNYGFYPKCVWLEDNMVMDFDIRTVEDYEAYTLGDMSYRRELYLMSRREKLTLGNLAAQSGFSIFGKRPIDYLKEKQVYRPLSVPERARFETQQACMADRKNFGKDDRHCYFFGEIDYSRAYENGVSY